MPVYMKHGTRTPAGTALESALEDERLQLEHHLEHASQLYARADDLQRQAAWVEANASLSPDNDRDGWDETEGDVATHQRERAGELIIRAITIEAQAYARLKAVQEACDALCCATVPDDGVLMTTWHTTSITGAEA